MQNKDKFSHKRQFGNIGEDLACVFLIKIGFTIIDRNYLKKWGEIDIVAKKNNIFHFIEVKSAKLHVKGFDENELKDKNVTREMDSNSKNIVSRLFSRKSFTKINDFSLWNIALSRESEEDVYRPEENVNYFKQKRLLRTIETYMLEKKFNDDQEWQIDVITVKIDFLNKKCIIKHIENVIFDV